MNIFTFTFNKLWRPLLLLSAAAGLMLLTACMATVPLTPLQSAITERNRGYSDVDAGRLPKANEIVQDTLEGSYTSTNSFTKYQGARYGSTPADYYSGNPKYHYGGFTAGSAAGNLLRKYADKHPDMNIEEVDKLYVRSVRQTRNPSYSYNTGGTNDNPEFMTYNTFYFNGLITKRDPSVPDPDTVGKGSFIDNRDGKVYKTAKIGGQTWMAQNLNYRTADGSRCYKDKPEMCAKYGRLYTWNAAKTVCPSGWHLPSRAEWDTLVVNVASGVDIYGQKSIASLRLRSPDDLGFLALPGGFLGPKGFKYEGSYWGWWTATEAGGDKAAKMHIPHHKWWERVVIHDVSGEDDLKSNGVSVRCVANE
ncbi:MAG: hypothetical protein LBC59_09995 [Chitinispirillales bacterium]|jgi:uncharacterized protein (TIGR02145 family)|nr:hypothetical protein [Chitinispirillales bacterium]